MTLDIGGTWNEVILHYVPEDSQTEDAMVLVAVDNAETVYPVQF